MTIQELNELLTSLDFKEIRRVCTSQQKRVDINRYRSQWYPREHDVMNPGLRKNRKVKVSGPNGELIDGEEAVNRIAIPFQRNIVSKAVTFLFGNPVAVTANTSNVAEEVALQAVQRVLDDAKIDSKNREIARDLFRSTEVAELWYVTETEPHDDYGFRSNVRIRMAYYSPWYKDVELYPLFDERDDLIALCKEFTTKGLRNRVTTHFEIYTADIVQRWVRDGSAAKWENVLSAPNPFKKIQGVYGEQEEAEWDVVQTAMDRAEFLISVHGDINDYNGSPILVSQGEIISLSKKGAAGKVIEVVDGGDLKYISWDAAPESIKLELENLFKIIHQFTQTPELSFENVKGIAGISGIALKLLFMDAHLKVMDKREIFDPYLARRNAVVVSILKHISGTELPGLKTLKIKNEIKPFMIEDRKEFIDMLYTASGGKAMISQKTATEKSGLADDAQAEYDQIKVEEAEATNLIDDEPTF